MSSELLRSIAIVTVASDASEITSARHRHTCTSDQVAVSVIIVTAFVGKTLGVQSVKRPADEQLLAARSVTEFQI